MAYVTDIKTFAALGSGVIGSGWVAPPPDNSAIRPSAFARIWCRTKAAQAMTVPCKLMSIADFQSCQEFSQKYPIGP